MTKTQLTQIDWIKAGFCALTTEGPAALRAEKLARDIGTTKGSFYWHFKDVADFKSHMLAHWLDRAYAGITAQINTDLSPQDQLYALMDLASYPPDDYGGVEAEPSIRAWARSDPNVAQAVEDIDQKRLTYLETLLKAAGKEPHLNAKLLYAALIGLQTLKSDTYEKTEAALKRLLTALLT